MNWYGWVGGCEEKDREYLESLGITVGEYDPGSCCFEGCRVPPRALKRLKKRWSDPWLYSLTRMRVRYEDCRPSVITEQIGLL